MKRYSILPDARKTRWILGLSALAALVLIPLLISSCQKSSGGAQAIAAARGLTPEELEEAAKTFVPPGKKDDYYIFASGGHSGQIHVIGIPSMRLLKTIPVFSNDAWQGYGLGTTESSDLFKSGSEGEDVELHWGDTHHPAISETDGDYDGKNLYINDRANGRIAMVDLRDFRTKQIIKIPHIQTSHGGCFVTPNTDYVHISSKVPMANAFADSPMPVTLDQHLNKYSEIYRGVSTFMKVDRANGGRMDLAKSFQIELPPYNQDLADAGKVASDGFAFINSYNTEMATGGAPYGKPTIEVGASKNDFDYMHVIDWKKAEQVANSGKAPIHKGIRVISMKTAIDEGILYLIPEPRSPHGVDVSPDGNYITVAGKLDPHVTVYGIDLIKKAIAAKNYEKKDIYGIPVLNYKACVAGQVELGAGPLHTQYDDKGNAYTSLFLENAVVKWTLPTNHSASEAFKVVDKVTTHYNIGHLAMPHGDTRHPQGKYVVAMNKWSIDRFGPMGTLLPQNFQLIDISGDKMKLIADMPIGFGEPHYAQIINTNMLHPIQVYPLGTDPITMKPSPFGIKSAKDARVERHGNVVDVYLSVIRSSFSPDIVEVHKGDHVRFHVTNVEQTVDATHGFAIPEYNIMASVDAGETTNVEFDAKRVGSFSYYCTEFCSALHLEMQGWLLVN
jgi:nitrous-oxide reductase